MSVHCCLFSKTIPAFKILSVWSFPKILTIVRYLCKCCIGFLGLSEQILQTGELQRAIMYHFTVLGVRGLKSRFKQSPVPSETNRGELFLAFDCFLHPSMACIHYNNRFLFNLSHLLLPPIYPFKGPNLNTWIRLHHFPVQSTHVNKNTHKIDNKPG